MVLVPNFDPGRSLLALQSGQNIAIDQAGAIQAQGIQLAQEGRRAALAPSQLAQSQNIVTQQEASIKIVQLQQLAAGKALKSKLLGQRLQRALTITDPTKQLAAIQSLDADAQDILGSAFNGERLLEDVEDATLLLSQVIGPNTQKIVTSATGEQFRLNRLGTGIEQIPVQRIGGIAQAQVGTVPAQAPAVGGIPTQVAQASNVIVTPAIAKVQRDITNKAEDRRLAAAKVIQDKADKQLDQTEKLIKNAKQDKRIDNFIAVTSNMDRINAATENLATLDSSLTDDEKTAITGVNDISLIFAFMKMLDPGSVVRESEFATAENAGGVPDTVRAVWNKLLGTGKLSANVRNNFVSQAKKIFNKSKVTAEGALRPILKRAKKFGLNAVDIRDAILGGTTPLGVPAGAVDTGTIKDGKKVFKVDGKFVTF